VVPTRWTPTHREAGTHPSPRQLHSLSLTVTGQGQPLTRRGVASYVVAGSPSRHARVPIARARIPGFPVGPWPHPMARWDRAGAYRAKPSTTPSTKNARYTLCAEWRMMDIHVPLKR
jgi:hypothetical protein